MTAVIEDTATLEEYERLFERYIDVCNGAIESCARNACNIRLERSFSPLMLTIECAVYFHCVWAKLPQVTINLRRTL